MEYTNIKLERENGVATIRLNRPNALNALSLELAQDLSAAVAEVKDDQSLKAVVVRGEGRAFCSGADLIAMDAAFADQNRLARYLETVNACFFQLEELPVPVIAAVHGFALAGGLELMLACDMTIAAEDARIGDQHVNFGLMPGGGSTQRLPRRIGMQRAMELLTTGRWLSGAEAAEWGLVLRAVPVEKLDQELEELLSPLSVPRAAPAWAGSSRWHVRGRDLSLRDGVALERLAFAQYVATSTHPSEGIQAFKEKRQPEF